MMKKAILCPAVNAVRASTRPLTQPQEFHFQTDKRPKPMTSQTPPNEGYTWKTRSRSSGGGVKFIENTESKIWKTRGV